MTAHPASPGGPSSPPVRSGNARPPSETDRYSIGMSVATAASEALRAGLVEHRAALDDVLRRYGATDARLFGSVARGDATPSSDCDVLVELDPAGGNELLRIAGIGEEFSQILGVRVDVVTPGLLRTAVSKSALADLIAL